MANFTVRDLSSLASLMHDDDDDDDDDDDWFEPNLCWNALFILLMITVRLIEMIFKENYYVILGHIFHRALSMW